MLDAITKSGSFESSRDAELKNWTLLHKGGQGRGNHWQVVAGAVIVSVEATETAPGRWFAKSGWWYPTVAAEGKTEAEALANYEAAMWEHLGLVHAARNDARQARANVEVPALGALSHLPAGFGHWVKRFFGAAH